MSLYPQICLWYIICMSDQRVYGGAIWTNHALERLGARGLTQELARQAFQNPDYSGKGKQKDSWEYRKKFGDSQVTVIAKQNEKHEWIILSCWIDPPLPGYFDDRKKKAYQKYKKAGFWGQLWMDFTKDLFGRGY